jgi:hypothetical protein
MEVVHIGDVKGLPVFCDKNAWGADHIVVVGRVKAHTDFDGEIESGLFKMMAIGLGKQHGAEHYHRAGHQYSYAEIFPMTGQAVLDSGHVLFGLATVENGYEQTAKVQAILPKDFAPVEGPARRGKGMDGAYPVRCHRRPDRGPGREASRCRLDPNVTGRASVQKRQAAARAPTHRP